MFNINNQWYVVFSWIRLTLFCFSFLTFEFPYWLSWLSGSMLVDRFSWLRWRFSRESLLLTEFVDFSFWIIDFVLDSLILKTMKHTRGCHAAGSRQPETIIAHAAVGGFAGGYAYDGSYMNSTTHRGVREKWCVLTVWCNYSAPLNMNPTNVLR